METVKEKTHGQTGIKMLRMAVLPDALPPVTKTQQKLVRILQEVDALSEKEACYLSGVTSAVAKKLVQNGVVESYTVKPPMHSYAGGGQTQQPRISSCLRNSRQSMTGWSQPWKRECTAFCCTA